MDETLFVIKSRHKIVTKTKNKIEKSRTFWFIFTSTFSLDFCKFNLPYYETTTSRGLVRHWWGHAVGRPACPAPQRDPPGPC